MAELFPASEPTDREIMESLLRSRRAAMALESRFGGMAEAIAASPSDLMSVDGMTGAHVVTLKAVHHAALRLLQDRVRALPVLGNWTALIDYLHASMAREPTEHLRVLFLDSKNRLIADEVMWQGTLNACPAYPREIMVRALALNAAAIILAHNHPSGDPTPSKADMVTTQDIKAACVTLAITMHDHLIVGASRVFSFRQDGLL